MTKEWYLVIVAITFREFLAPTLGSTKISQYLQPSPIRFIFPTVLCRNQVCGLILLQKNKCYFAVDFQNVCIYHF